MAGPSRDGRARSRTPAPPPADPYADRIARLRDAALRCLDCCASLSGHARAGEEHWCQVCSEGTVERLKRELGEAVELGADVEDEVRLTLAGRLATYGNITARNALVAALILGRKFRDRLRDAGGAREEMRAGVFSLFGYEHDRQTGHRTEIRSDFPGWRETIESEVARALHENAAARADRGDATAPAPGSVAGTSPAARGRRLPVAFSSDYSCMRCYDTVYSFTGAQAACMRVLHQAWLNGTPDVRNETLLDAAGRNDKKLPDLFKQHRRRHPAWGVVVVQGGTKGTTRLRLPEKLRK
jgi:hypothetical protein